MHIPEEQRGFSLVELLVALGLGLTLSASVVLVFVQNNRSALQDEELSRALENGRFVMRAIGREIAMSGFWGKFLDISVTTKDASVAVMGTDCGDGINPWATDLDNLQFLNDASAVTVAATFECLPSANVVAGTDIIAIKRVGDTSILDASLVSNQMYLRTNSIEATLFVGGVVDPPPAMIGTVSNWPYMPSIYYLRDYAYSVGDGIPSLCRANLDTSSPPNMDSECLIEGVENMQFEFGVDDDNDFIADYYTLAPTVAEIVDSVSVRLHILIRSLSELPSYTNDKTYNLGSVVVAAANDGFFRRVFSTTIVIRNPANLSGMGS